MINQMVQKIHKTSPKIKSGKSYSEDGKSHHFWSVMEIGEQTVVQIRVRHMNGDIINKQTLKSINSVVGLSILAPAVFKWLETNK